MYESPEGEAMAELAKQKAQQAHSEAQQAKPILTSGAAVDSAVDAVREKLHGVPETVKALHLLGAGEPYKYYY